MPERQFHYVWNQQRDDPWLAGMWEEEWPTETFTTGEALPAGPLAQVATFHNRGPIQHFGLRLFSVPHGWRKILYPFARVRAEGGNALVDGQFKVAGECGIFYHRLSENEPLMIKLEAPQGDGMGMIRVYTWWALYRREYERGGDGIWRPV